MSDRKPRSFADQPHSFAPSPGGVPHHQSPAGEQGEWLSPGSAVALRLALCSQRFLAQPSASSRLIAKELGKATRI